MQYFFAPQPGGIAVQLCCARAHRKSQQKISLAQNKMITFTRAGIMIFAVAVALGPVYTVDGYSVISNLISELGAQHTENNFIMIIAFAILGVSISVDGIKNFQNSLLPFIFFGAAMAIVGFFPHKPIDTAAAYSSAMHNLHGIVASTAGTAITAGFIWQGFRAKKNQRVICFYMALVSVVFPLLMLSFPSLQGIIQRIMYFQILSWIWVKYPLISDDQPPNRF